MSSNTFYGKNLIIFLTHRKLQRKSKNSLFKIQIIEEFSYQKAFTQKLLINTFYPNKQIKKIIYVSFKTTKMLCSKLKLLINFLKLSASSFKT